MANQVEHTTQSNAGIKGLTSEEVRAAQAAGKVNADATVKTRSYGSIFRSNICTLFNLINVILAVFVFLTGSYKNMLFMLVIVINTIIGIVQEIRSKITTDRLSIVVAAFFVVGFGWLFDIAPFTPEMWQSFGIAALVNIVAFNYLYNVLDARHQRKG